MQTIPVQKKKTPKNKPKKNQNKKPRYIKKRYILSDFIAYEINLSVVKRWVKNKTAQKIFWNVSAALICLREEKKTQNISAFYLRR